MEAFYLYRQLTTIYATSIDDRKYRPKDSDIIGKDKSIDDGLVVNTTDDVADLLSCLYLKCAYLKEIEKKKMRNEAMVNTSKH